MKRPTFLIIGAAKAGTTSLHHYLGQHPQVFMSAVKEPRFFALAGRPLDWRGPGDERIRRTTATTLAAYRSLFTGVRDERAIGESSTIYLESEVAPGAIAEQLPDARLVVILRNPADRAYSAFLHLRGDGCEPESDFEKALDAEPRRIASGWYHYWRYRERGFYHRHLSRYFQRFDPDRIRVHLYEDLSERPEPVLADLFEFLGVDPGFRPDFRSRLNAAGLPRSIRWQRVLTGYHPVKEALRRVVPEPWGHRVIRWLRPRPLPAPPLKPDTRARLVAGFRDDILALEQLIGRDLSRWLEPIGRPG